MLNIYDDIGHQVSDDPAGPVPGRSLPNDKEKHVISFGKKFETESVIKPRVYLTRFMAKEKQTR